MEYDLQFIKPEIRSGWEVSELTKKVWSVQLDLIKKLDEVCKKNHLRWFPMYGTLLGVVRHHGFIPWDDDVDIAMPREDYDKLLSLAETEFKQPYFLQTTLNDEEYFGIYSCLRNSETTGNRRTCLEKKQNSGIGIDIAPLDGCEDNLIIYHISRFPARVAAVMGNTYVNDFNQMTAAKILRRILRFTGFNYKKAYVWLERNNRKFKACDYNKVAVRTHSDHFWLSKDMWDKADFDSVVYMPFENMDLPVPAGYDHLLRQIYDDYMEFPPIDKRKEKHDMVFEPDVPYKQYCAEKYGVKYKE